MGEVSDVCCHGDHLSVKFDGLQHRFHYFWLRDNCPKSRSSNGQRLHESNAIDPNISPESVTLGDRGITVQWADGLTSEYSSGFLIANAYDGVTRASRNFETWDVNVKATVVKHDYHQVIASSQARKAWLEDVSRFGFAMLSHVPTVPETLLDVVSLFGFVRETNYGKLFDVRAEKNASNLAYTPQALSVHTDNPYRDPCPTLQLLHCLVQAEQGGITALVDGFAAADRLRKEDPFGFELLTSCDVRFCYHSDDSYLENTDRVITLDSAGNPRRIRVNNRSMAPLKLPFDQVQDFYSGMFKFRDLLEAESAQYRFTMEPGDLVVFDNERVLHGRVGLSIGERHLQGCYADRDGLLSTLHGLGGSTQ
ncbi:MAG: TauD/TfdA family dioxygenase [Pseudomonadota bacterium]